MASSIARSNAQIASGSAIQAKERLWSAVSLDALNCRHCRLPLVPEARFCGECGTPKVVQITSSNPAMMPDFAKVRSGLTGDMPKELAEEMASLLVTLMRERFFLMFHFCLFLSTNLLGFWLAYKAYVEFSADEVTRAVMSLTPFLFINSLALGCLIPIKGTKAQIKRIKERMTHLHYQIEYRGII